jgi:hypothetical protein
MASYWQNAMTPTEPVLLEPVLLEPVLLELRRREMVANHRHPIERNALLRRAHHQCCAYCQSGSMKNRCAVLAALTTGAVAIGATHLPHALKTDSSHRAWSAMTTAQHRDQCRRTFHRQMHRHQTCRRFCDAPTGARGW